MQFKFSFYILLVASIFTFIQCELEDPNEGIDTSEIISISTSDVELLADGVARMTLTAKLLEKADPNLDITFTTEAGYFPIAGTNAQETTITASGREATITLQSDNYNLGTVTVSASVGNYVASKDIECIAATAEMMTISTDRQTVIANRVDFAQITTKLFRNIGTPTIGTRIDYEVIALDTAEASVIPFDYVNENLESIVNIKSANSKVGKVQIKVSTDGVASELIDIEFVE